MRDGTYGQIRMSLRPRNTSHCPCRPGSGWTIAVPFFIVTTMTGTEAADTVCSNLSSLAPSQLGPIS